MAIKKSKLRIHSEEIAKLERQVTRRINQLDKLGVETERPKHEKPKTVKQAKEIIFQMESFLRHTSTNASERKGAERGAKIKTAKREAKQIDRDYNTVKKGMEKAKEYFLDNIAKPINESREKNGFQKRDFSDELQEFMLGLNPNKIKNERYKEESKKRLKELVLEFKKDPHGYITVAEKPITQLRLNILHSLRNATSSDEYDEIAKRLNGMSDKEFLEHYKANKSTYNSIMFDSDQEISDLDMYDYTSEVKESLGL
jgi:hypothetical protein